MDVYQQLIDDLEQELRKSIGEVPSLAKSEDQSESKEEDKKEEDKKDESKEEGSHDYSNEDLEELEKMYGSMQNAEHGHHLKALKKAMAKCWKAEDMDKCWKSESEEAKSKEEAKEEDKKEEPKKEEEMEKCGDVMAKSESGSSVESLKKENDELKKNLEGLVSAMATFVTKAPARKAITDVSIIKKSEGESEKVSLSKSEITKILTKKAQDPSLSKSDREAINAFYFNKAGLDAIKHLLS